LDFRKTLMPKLSSRNCYTLTGFTRHYLFLILGSIFAFFLYLLIAWLYLNAQEIWSPDAGAKLLQLKSLRFENGKFAYDILYWGAPIDPELHYTLSNPSRDILRIINDKLFLDRFPIFPILTLPFYHYFGMKGLYILPALGGALIVFFSLSLIEPPDRNILMYLLIAFGSPVLIYATMFWEHTIASCLGIIGLWMAFLSARFIANLRILIWILIGLLFSIAIYMRLELAIFTLAFLFSYWLLGDCKWGPLAAGVIIFLALIVYQPLHEILFSGVEVPKNAEYVYKPFTYIRWVRWAAMTELLVGPYADESIHTGIWGTIWSISASAAVFFNFLGRKRMFGVLKNISLGFCIGIGFYFLFTKTPYRSAHGLIFSTTWVVLAFTKAKTLWSLGSTKVRILVLTAIIGILGYSIAMIVLRGSSPHGGLEWGARFAFTFFPILAIMAAWKYPEKNFSLEHLFLILFVILGVGFQIRGLCTIRADKDFTATLNQTILASSEQHILSDIWWLSMNAAPILDQKPIYVANSPEKLAQWIDAAVENGVWEFTLVTFSANLPAEISDSSSTYGLYVDHIQKIGLIIFYTIVIGLG